MFTNSSPQGVVITELKLCSLPEPCQDEQRDLQPYLRDVIKDVLQSRFPGRFVVEISVGGESPKPSVKVLGTSFWPDLEIREAETNQPILGMEVKCVRTSRLSPKALVETIGQSMIYRLRYPMAIGFVLYQGKYDLKLGEENSRRLILQLSQHQIELIIRQHGMQ